MADPSTHINYSFEDIQRYLQGKMPAAEMHAIEKAALQDPFLADAIEGFNDVDAATAQQHLNEINAGLFRERQPSKIIILNKNRWLNVAAMVFIIAGAGVLGIYFLRDKGDRQQVAQVRKEAAENRVLSDSVATEKIRSAPVQPDGIALNKSKQPSSKAIPYLEEKEFNRQIAKDDDKKSSVQDATVLAARAQPPVPEGNPEMRAAPLSNQINDSLRQNLSGKVSGVNIPQGSFTGKVIDENNNPIPGVYVVSADKKAAVVTDMNGNFNLYKNDSLLNVTASAVGYESQNAYLRASNSQTIVLKGTMQDLTNEVVVLANGKKKKPADRLAAPVGGWENFNRYVLSQLNKDTTAENDIATPEQVELEFLVDKSGTPYDIKITRSLDEHRNAKAIDILKNGPKWTNTSRKKKAKVAINF